MTKYQQEKIAPIVEQIKSRFGNDASYQSGVNDGIYYLLNVIFGNIPHENEAMEFEFLLDKMNDYLKATK